MNVMIQTEFEKLILTVWGFWYVLVLFKNIVRVKTQPCMTKPGKPIGILQPCLSSLC